MKLMSEYTQEVYSAELTWNVAVFASRETTDVLKATLTAVQAAVKKPTNIDVLVNGNRTLAENAMKIISTLARDDNLAKFRLWFIALGDKAHTWNVYLHNIWPGEGLAYFIDGYARPYSNALALLEQGLGSHAVALGASGVPTIGRTAAKSRTVQIIERGIHGNLFCLRTDTMRSLRASGFRLPLGLYRMDSTIGAVLKYSFNPKKFSWNPERILVESEASWATDEKFWWSYAEMRGQFKRRIRQAQGDLENRSVRHHLSKCKRAPQDMPVTINELVAIWRNENPLEAGMFLKNPLRKHAINIMQRPRDWSLAELFPELIAISASS